MAHRIIGTMAKSGSLRHRRQQIAKATAWKDYADRNETTKALMDAARELL